MNIRPRTGQPTMHRCFAIAEILRIVCEEILGKDDGPTGTLVALARTCRTFLDPAIDVLWRKQDSLLPLLECLPQDLWEYDSSNCYTFKPVNNHIDWSRFDHYASRVRKMTVLIQEHELDPVWLSGSQKYLDAIGFRMLSSLRPRYTLLPNLQSFTSNALHDPLASSFLHPHLKSLQLDFRSDDTPFSRLPFGEHFSQIILQIREKCPSLEYLSLILNYSKISGRVPTCEIETLQNLRGFDIQSDDYMIRRLFMQCLALLPRLEEVSLKSGSGLSQLVSWLSGSLTTIVEPYCDHVLSAPSNPFPTLRSLSLSIESGDEWSELEPLLCCSPLRVIQFHFSNSAFPRLGDIVGSLAQFRALTSINISSDFADVADFQLDAQTIRRLFPLKELQELSFAPYPHSELDDNLLKDMLLAWPKLIVLQLPLIAESSGRMSLSQDVTGLTPGCFESIARHGVNLKTLEITIDTSDIDFMLDRPYEEWSGFDYFSAWIDEDGRPLRNLSLSDITLEDCNRLELRPLWDLLCEIFPNTPHAFRDLDPYLYEYLEDLESEVQCNADADIEDSESVESAGW